MALLNTDTPIDQIIIFREGTVSVPAISSAGGGFWNPGTATATVPLDMKILPYVEYSLTPDFADTSTMDLVPVDFILSSTSQAIGIACVLVNSFDNRTEISFWNFNSTSSVTVYYRLYGFAPTNSDSIDVPSTAGLGSLNVPVFNTDLNYMQIIGNGISSGGTVNFTNSISQAWVWAQEDVFINPSIGFQNAIMPIRGEYIYMPGSSTRSVVITENSLILNSVSGRTYHYRAYA